MGNPDLLRAVLAAGLTWLYETEQPEGATETHHGIYFSASREQRQDLRRRQAVAERLRHHTLNRINAELAQRADTDPPAYTATVHDIGHPGGES